ncbi:MAG: response regulator transcription factor [Rhizobacter sp.]|nr:response regulator transcription factor [Ferruginibacter sp.]
MYEGLTGPQIAEKLFLSPFTIKTPQKNLLQKLNVSGTQLMLRYVKENKLI